MVAWTIGYGTLRKRKTERMEADAEPRPSAP
jgi:hypothetical protein